MSAEAFRHNFESVRQQGLTVLRVTGNSASVTGVSDIVVSVVAQPPGTAAVPDDAVFFQGVVTQRPIPIQGWEADVTIEPGALQAHNQVLLAGVALGSTPADPMTVWSGTLRIKTATEK